MKKATEIIFNDNSIFDCNDILDLKKGEKFYFSMHSPSPRAISDYKKEFAMYNEYFLDSFIDSIEKKCKEFHIKHFKIISVTNSIQIDMMSNMSDSEKYLKHTRSITVKEVFSIRSVYYSIYWKIKRYFAK